ncbi:MAG: class I SAM-dependent methyltransferase [Planctomycetota bacterium]
MAELNADVDPRPVVTSDFDIARGDFTRGRAPDVHSSSDAYAERFSGRAGAYLLAVQSKLVLELASPWRDGSVLEVGGGHGQLVGPMLEAGYDVTLHGSIEACRSRPDRLVGPERYRFVCGPMMKLPVADASYDVVVAIRLLAHVQDAPKLVSELCRVARHAVIVDFASAVGFNALAPMLFKFKRKLEGNTRRFLLRRPSEVKALFSGQGWTRMQSRGQFVSPLAAHRLLGRPSLSALIEWPPRALGLTDRLGSPIILRAEPGGTAEGRSA